MITRQTAQRYRYRVSVATRELPDTDLTPLSSSRASAASDASAPAVLSRVCLARSRRRLWGRFSAPRGAGERDETREDGEKRRRGDERREREVKE